MNDLQTNLALRDVKLVARMRSGWQFGYDGVDYFAEKNHEQDTRVSAESLSELLNLIDGLSLMGAPRSQSAIMDKGS
jgi:hypothetical protein